jgi:hypothetical protein
MIEVGILCVPVEFIVCYIYKVCASGSCVLAEPKQAGSHCPRDLGTSRVGGDVMILAA